ncbi:MAG: Flp family type IVb pilin [Sphingomonadales bacterium]
MLELLRTLRRDEAGGTAIEYGLIIALISVVAIVAMSAVGTSLDEMYNIIIKALGDGS